MSKVRFRYGLQPLLLTRGWEVDALRRDLAVCNARVTAQEAQVDGMRARMLAADADWRVQAATGGLAVDQFVRYQRYRVDLADMLAREETRLQEEQTARDELAGRLTGAKRALEAVEKHRDDMKSQFLRERMRSDLKVADDHWSILQTGRASGDSQV